MQPLLTIGVPVYNEEKFIRATLDSLLSQSFKDFNLIVSDNCSTDYTYEIAKEYAKKDDRVTVVKQEENIGVIDNFISVLKRAKSKYFMWAGGHDIFESHYFKEGVEYLEQNPESVLAYPNTVFFDESGTLPIPSSDIDTIGLSRGKAIYKISRNLYDCSSIHGIFKLETLLNLKFHKGVGFDNLIIYQTAEKGEIKQLSQGLNRRIVRKESKQAKSERYKEAKITQANASKEMNRYIKRLFTLINKMEEISLIDKLMIYWSLVRRYGLKFNWISL
ncbi:glycosyltransferase family 2 protein [Marinoscillum furvescens]|uniref:Glycosyl transferase family 2 n=1 Tax=Marinoscillum furvescens DSM 4134 TaxID=1122208 RepID=A0A3D9L0C4_MARFU|nr:glycosyltransferase family 2 protein [Marinoscillum furvescens]RED96627.1 glycosyl transferase family 2 [Marinoscillum furvescens DSM 4134]